MAELIPEVLDALTERFARSRVQTILGPSPEWLETELFAVGVSTGDVDAVEQSSTRAGFGAKRAHVFDVVSIAHVRSGDSDKNAMRRVTTRVFELVAFARQAVADDRTLGGLVMRADLTNTNYLPRFDSGAVAVVEFRVRIDAHR